MGLPGSIWKAFRTSLTRRHGGVTIFLGVFLAVSLLIRAALLVKSAHDVSWDASILAVLGWGLLFDFATASWMAMPWILLLTVLPSQIFRKASARGAVYLGVFVMLYALLFGAVAEWFFWDEFGARFNFIAVDYLVYTTEVLGNIRESYPMPLIFAGLFTASALLFWLVWRTGLPKAWLRGEHEHARRRWITGGAWIAVALAAGTIVHSNWLPSFGNNFNRELARNGLWSLFAAFWDNELEYERFYATLPLDETFAHLRQELTEDGSLLLRPGDYDTLRYVRNAGPEQHLNIIQITVESLSAGFLGAWNPESNLTPNLDALAAQSLIFTRFYATGTRTDRGMEALALSLPPTPGRSIVKRPGNEDLFSFGSVLRAKGYETAFIYGGYGYFDNMNYFFGHNGYRLVDRNSVADDDVTFANAWGACDEDLFNWTVREADAAHSAGRPFHFFVMTTSNHRPYTFPEGRIDLPSKVSGRSGAVKYTDYAIGKLVRDASTKPWFRNTVFVIVADHCAASAGKTELPVENYHIPLLIYTPGGQIAPGRIDTLTSQMDYAPTLLGLLGWTYPSRFFGHDVRRVEPSDAHALIGTYQKLGHLEKGEFVVLVPQHKDLGYSVDAADKERPTGAPTADAEREAIGFYQAASYVFHHGIYRALSREEFEHFLAQGEALAVPHGAGVSSLP
jgi:phosphoglycerol transferase MdoB-like AlkP superfamily enzyme